MRTSAEEFQEPSSQDERLHRMKHLRLDGVTFVEMIAIFIGEGLIPEHEDHEKLPIKGSGRRTDARNRAVCARCEHILNVQWSNNIVNLSMDEAVLLDRRWQWMNTAARQIVKYEQLAVAPVVTVTTVWKKIESEDTEAGSGDSADKGSAEEAGDAYVVETTRQEKRVTSPAYFKMADELRANIARLAGVPVGDLSKVPTESRSSQKKKSLVLYERTDGDGESAEPTN